MVWEEGKKIHDKVITNVKAKSYPTYLCVAEHSTQKGNFITSPKTDFIKPHVEEIIATEETPNPNEILPVETEKDMTRNQRAAKKTDGKAAVAEMVPQPTESLDRQGKKPLEKKP